MCVNCDEQIIASHFSQVGEVVNVEVLRELDGASRGQALVIVACANARARSFIFTETFGVMMFDVFVRLFVCLFVLVSSYSF